MALGGLLVYWGAMEVLRGSYGGTGCNYGATGSQWRHWVLWGHRATYGVAPGALGELWGAVGALEGSGDTEELCGYGRRGAAGYWGL